MDKLNSFYKNKDSSPNQKYNQRNSQFIDSPTRKSDLEDFNEKFKKQSKNISGKV